MMSSTSVTGMLTAGASGGRGEQHPGPAPGQQPQRHADQQGDPGQAERLPFHHAQHLAPHQAECLQHGQVAAPPPHRGDEHVSERAHGEQGQDAAEDQGVSRTLE